MLEQMIEFLLDGENGPRGITRTENRIFVHGVEVAWKSGRNRWSVITEKSGRDNTKKNAAIRTVVDALSFLGQKVVRVP
jgi:hypothetical protein